jgi:hypothetical protein
MALPPSECRVYMPPHLAKAMVEAIAHGSRKYWLDREEGAFVQRPRDFSGLHCGKAPTQRPSRKVSRLFRLASRTCVTGTAGLDVRMSLDHAPRDEGTRIISMRKGNRREQEIYQKRLGTD